MGSTIHPKHLTSTTFKDKYDNSCVNCHPLKIDVTPAVNERK
ncbi:hypothetical protein CHY_2172 [Carboxydothermus hydrogenoformans Z-2901]|uniref:Uncharacterized protein n=1 Tax=Carboxydothermus hydrogenoformans (strain ATCC BAA-161 / DSM 6008 / Z-2901) TaxID=246194 RepID=Q3AA48_CARHZ|nr:hypothetical protein CHY_2172 [Carboxydothermus hydrogenoformans Z-2901]